MQHVAADDRQVGRCLIRGGLFHQAVDLHVLFTVHSGDVRASVGADLVFRHLHESHDRPAGGLLDVNHALQQIFVLVDEVITEQHGEGVITHVGFGAQHCVAQPLGVLLAEIVDFTEVGGVLDFLEQLVLPGFVEGRLERGHTVEVVF